MRWAMSDAFYRNDYGGSCCEHVTRFLEAGYRVSKLSQLVAAMQKRLNGVSPVAMDLPGHGRSTGLHGYIANVRTFS